MTNWELIFTDVSAFDLIVNCCLKSTVVFVLAFSLIRLFKNGPAAYRYAIWKLTFVVLCLILFAGLLPSISIKQVDQAIGQEITMGEIPLPYEKILQNDSQHELAITQAASDSNTFEITDLLPYSLSSLVVLCWITISILILIYLMFELILMRRIGMANSSISIPDEWISMLERAKEQMNIFQAVKVIISEKSTSPYVFGWKEAIIVLPEEARCWERQKLQTVFLHELGHIRQKDFRTNLFVLVIRAFYWWNPAVWWAAKQIRLESEYCCDTLVLRTGMVPHDYAQHLVEIARETFIPSQKNVVTTIPIIRQSQLKDRVVKILRPSIVRSYVGLLKRANHTVMLILPFLFLNFSYTGSIDHNKTERFLINQLMTNNSNAQVNAAKQLGELQSAAAFIPLSQNLENENPQVRAMAAWALGQIQNQAAIPKLLDLLQDKNDCVKEWTLLSLGEFGVPKSFYSVVKTQEHPKAEVRKAVLWSLYQIGCLPAFHHISQHLNDEQEDVRLFARKLLEDFPKDKLRTWMKRNQNKNSAQWIYEHVEGIKQAGTINLLIRKLANDKADEQKLMIVIQANPSVKVLNEIWAII